MRSTVKIKKNVKLDVAYVQLRKGKVAETLEIRPGILMDLDKNGELLGIEVLSLEKLAPLLEGTPKNKSYRRAA